MGCAVGVSFTDGEPTAAETNGHGGLWWNGVGHGYSFTVPADTTERILRVYVQGIEGRARKILRASHRQFRA